MIRLYSWVFFAICPMGFSQPPNQPDLLTELENQVAALGGFEAIDASFQPLRRELQARIDAATNDWQFKRGMHRFNRKITASAIKAEWKVQAEPDEAKFPPVDVVIDFHNKLAEQGIKLIFVPVPSKIEAYADRFETPFPSHRIVSLGRVKTMMTLLRAGVEVVDVLPLVLQAKHDTQLPLYETSGHHLSGYGAKRAGEWVAQYLNDLPLSGRNPKQFTDIQQTGTERVDRRIPMQTWEVRYADGRSYEHQLNAQVAVIGDSNAFAFKKASWASHIAKNIGVPVADHSTSSGGSFAHLQLAELGLASLQRLKAVVWIVASTHMERFGWSMGVLPEKATVRGLAAAGRIEEAFALFATHQKSYPNQPPFSESQMNRTGYSLLGAGKYKESIAIFQLNTRAYPNSANTIDSLGEAYARDGQAEKAKAAFLKALSLNPSENVARNSIENLEDLGFKPNGEPLHKPGDLPPWPVVDGHVAFQFKTERHKPRAWKKGQKEPLFNYSLEPKGFAYTDSQGRLSVKHGHFLANNTEGFLTEAFSGNFTLECFATPMHPISAGVIWQLQNSSGHPELGLRLQKQTLELFAGSAPSKSRLLVSAPLPKANSYHLAVVREHNRLRVFVNGKTVAETPNAGSLVTLPKTTRLSFGSATPTQAGWAGFLEGIALHRVALNPKQMAQQAEAYFHESAKRTKQPHIKLRAKLIKKSKPAELDQIAPYRRSLAVYEYQVLAILEGQYESKVIRVAHWTLLDGQFHPHRNLKEGDEINLWVNAFNTNRQLRNVHLSDTLPLNFDRELFYQTRF